MGRRWEEFRPISNPGHFVGQHRAPDQPAWHKTPLTCCKCQAFRTEAEEEETDSRKTAETKEKDGVREACIQSGVRAGAGSQRVEVKSQG